LKNNDESFVHVFFVDVVSLSNRDLGSTESQRKKLEVLFKFITNSRILKKTLDSVIMNHTGDGVAICFRDTPRLPLELAIDLHKKLGKYNQGKMKNEKIRVRIGINSGLISKMKGVSDRENYWGRGLNLAQRIMNLGNANHILISAVTATELIEVSEKYDKNMHYIGDVKIKHGETVPVYSAHGEGFGNKTKPHLLKQQIVQDIEESGRLILEGLKKHEINPQFLLELFKQQEQSKLSLASKKKRRKHKK